MKQVLPGALLVLAATVGAEAPLDCASLANSAVAEPANYARQCQGGNPALAPAFAAGIKATADDDILAYAVQITTLGEAPARGLYSFLLGDFAGAQRVGEPDVPLNIQSIKFNPSASRLFGAQVFPNGTTVTGTINTDTGVASGFVNQLSQSDQQVTGLAINPRTHETWLSTSRRLTNNPPLSESYLWRYDLFTGALNLLGRLLPEESDPVFIDIAVNCRGQLYGHNISDDSLYHINTNDLVTTRVGSHGLSANFAQGMAFDNRDDTLYAWIYTGDGNNTFGTLDLETGALQVLAQNSPRGEWVGAIPTRCPAIPIADPAAFEGAWFAPYSNGQGFTVRYFEDPGIWFMPWFTFTPEPDEIPDDSDLTEFLRWYVLQGEVQPGDEAIDLIIAEVTDGRFDAADPVTRVRAGEARISMLSCTEAALEYSFDEGFNDGQSGVIGLSRLSGLTPTGKECADANDTILPAAAAYDPAYTGHWFDPESSGQGLELFRVAPVLDEDGDIERGAIMYGAWFTFDPEPESDGPEGQHWFTLQGEQAGEEDDDFIRVSIIRTVGGVLDGSPAAGSVSVGTVTLTPVACDRLDLAYEFSDTESVGAFRDLEGEIQLQRIGACPGSP